MDSRLIAQVWAPKNNGKNAIGTAYPIGKDLLLTARHVVVFVERAIDQPIRIVWEDLKDPLTGQKPYSIEVSQNDIVFDGGNDYDVVLIKCSVPSKAYISPWMLSERHPVAGDRWHSWGYAFVGKEDGQWKKIPAMGEVFPPNQCSAVLHLESKGDAKEKEGWQGVSGAPVFIAYHLIAVLTETPKDLNERLKAVSIPYLLQQVSAFKDLIGAGRFDKNFNSAVITLQKSASAKKALFARLSRDHTVSDSAEDIVDYLAAMPIPQLIEVIRDAQKNQTDETRQYLARLVREMLPSLFDPALALSLRSASYESVSGIIEIPYATDVSAEMLMANIDHRPADIRLVPIDIDNPDLKQAKPGRYKLSLPPESGPVGATQQFADIEDDLFNRLGAGHDLDVISSAVDEHLFKKVVPRSGRSFQASDKRKLIRSALESNASRNKPGYYWIWNFPNENHRERYEALAREIKAHYPAITLLRLEGDIDSMCEEIHLFGLFSDTQDV